MQRASGTRDSFQTERVRVLLPLPLSGAYDYRLPEGIAVEPGGFVIVPLGKREVAGVIWGAGTGAVADQRLKDIIGPLDVPPLTEELRRLIDWVAGYTLSPPGAVLRMVMNVPKSLVPEKPAIGYAPAAGASSPMGDPEPTGNKVRITPARKRVLEALDEGPPLAIGDLVRKAGVGASVVRDLAETGLLAFVALPAAKPFPVPDWRRPGPDLSPAQQDATQKLRALVGDCESDEGFSVTLLDGVTGSGKTEVYFEAVAKCLERGRQALVLVPEIALTAQWLTRFETRFGAPPAEWHSDLGSARRRRTWRAVAEGAVRVVVGARSALFLPFADLGLIVVDEEHDTSFKQEDGVVYNARDMAVVRGRLAEIPVVLSSATPSLETVENVNAGRYGRLHLPERHAGAALPDIRAIDMRAEPMGRQSWLSPTLRVALAETFEAGEQAMLYLNRRGYAPLTLCRACGYRLECPHCTAWLVEHRLAARLECHHCGFATRPPGDCPECGAADAFAACGPGVERLAEEVSQVFPDARVAIMASDTVTGPAAAAALVQRVQEHDIDLLIGTQIMAKGHHFPLLTMVGVVDADLGLAGGDLRAAERTYQLLHQVAGRAGRESRPGRVILQTYQPDHPVICALVAGDRDTFLAAEAKARRDRRMPPFGRLAAVIVSGRDEGAVDAASRALGRTAPHGAGVDVLGPAPAPLAMIRGRHRRRLLLKAEKEVNVQAVLRRWLDQVRVKGGVRVDVDVDPYSFL